MSRHILAIIAAIVLILVVIATLGPMIGFSVGALFMYVGYRQAGIQEKSWVKLLCWTLVVVGFFIGISNLFGALGFLAVYLLVRLYERWTLHSHSTLDTKYSR
ncbi:hypothetical protein [Geomicrobium sp. JCM 19039]|uniref:lmo0954 family membrane protein n=1 Tax=Geomicrobium sp. JCM 19039 TaxID=1460636 RepID=UPI00045F3BA9|nr:hypothetical protein [Geomicrobium sp. JCM 19039]GAK14218.1 hypothetical protein JCM19039_4120 [Geomicrobium sp. JCM 19039]